MKTLEQRISILEKKLRITEKNALQAYFSEHPEKIKEFGTNSGGSWRDLAIELFRDNPISKNYYKTLKSFEAKYPECFKDANYCLGLDTIKKIQASPEPIESFKQMFPREYDKSPKDYDELFEDFINDKTLLKLKYLKKESSKYSEAKFKKLANQFGINLQDLTFGFSEIIRMQSSSYQKLKPISYALLKAMTVIPSQLPPVIYRGFFMDGAKIKDQEKFLKQWAVGNSPKVKLGKPTSWSSSKSVAVEFMDSQDRVKNAKEGYHVLIKISNPTEEEVIADLRNFEFSHFWNQQEILVAPEVTRYTVAELIPYQEYNDPENKYKEFEKSNQKPAAGGWGKKKSDLLIDIFNLSRYDISLDTKIYYKEIKNLTIGELVKKGILPPNLYDMSYGDKVNKILLPLFKLISQGFVGKTDIFRVNGQSSVIVSCIVDFNRFEHNDFFGKTFEGTGLFSKVRFGNDARVALLTQIDLIQNNINAFAFNVKFLEYQLVYSEKSPGEEIVKYMETKNPIMEELFIKEISNIEKRFPNVKINVK